MGSPIEGDKNPTLLDCTRTWGPEKSLSSKLPSYGASIPQLGKHWHGMQTPNFRRATQFTQFYESTQIEKKFSTESSPPADFLSPIITW